MTPHREYVEGLPSGLIACRVGNEQVHVAGVSPRCVTLRSPEPLPCDAALTLHLYQVKTGKYACISIDNYETGEARRENDAVLTRFLFDDPACEAAIRRALDDFARYVEIRSSDGASAFGRMTTGYPLEMDELFPSSAEEQWDEWFSAFPPLPAMEADCSLAVSLNCRELWELYLNSPVEDFLSAYAALKRLPRSVLPARAPDRLYIGNESCRFVFPEMNVLKSIAAKARRDVVSLTLVTADLHVGDEDCTDMLLAFAAEHGMEVEVNDWGTLHRAQALHERVPILLGTLLNRRRKDPRMQWKAGYSGYEDLLSRNSLNDPGWQAFLESLGVVRFEYESCNLPTQLPNRPCSLHLPFYRTNSSRWCPLRSICTAGNRGAQSDAESCPRWCEKNSILYPTHLKLLGCWNSLLALDADIREIPRGCDRWVLNF